MMKNMQYESSSKITETELHPVDVSEHFDGQKHRNWRLGVPFINPRDLEGGAQYSELHYNRDILGRQTLRPKDLQRYLDPTDGKPRRLIVQATPQALAEGSGDWRRTKVRGHAPPMLRLSNWVLKNIFLKPEGHKYTAQEIAIVVGKSLVATPLLTCLVMVPMNSTVHFFLPYTGVATVSWEYPLYARNNLDASPMAVVATRTWRDANGIERQDVFDPSKQHARRLKPNYLVVRHGQNWNIEENVHDLPYLMVSFTRKHFASDSEALYRKAAELTTEAGLQAYWVDYCIQPVERRGPRNFAEDIHTICDIVRGAHEVVVVVKDMSSKSLTEWGRRMWTLPEVLLSSNEVIRFAPIQGIVEERSRLSLATEVWQNDQEARQLAEHFSGKLTLSRLELISVALTALSLRETNLHSPGDLAYCLMGLLGQRPAANPDDNLFQALARLSLANDSDRIIERLTCMLPQVPSERCLNKEFILDDRFGSKLWDIEPLCQVAGVCHGRAVILDGCRGITIKWDTIPTIEYIRRNTTGRQAAEMIARAGPLPLLIGIFLASFSGATKAFGILLLLLGLGLVLASPYTIMTVYGGKIWGAAPHLIGFEGTLPIREVERMTFGNAIGRLKYAPSSSLFADKSEHERIGKEPTWIGQNQGPPSGILLDGQRLFTLIDTGTMTVSVFAAERPPSVALIAGREGGMLRVVLCSYERSTSALIKESVLRMETPMLDKARLLGWVKLQ